MADVFSVCAFYSYDPEVQNTGQAIIQIYKYLPNTFIKKMNLNYYFLKPHWLRCWGVKLVKKTP